MTFRQVLLASTAATVLAIGVPASCVISPAAAQVNVGVSVTVDDLRGRVAPQGEFVKVETIGEVWRPRGLPADWKPYTRGNWIYNSEVGWYFNSDEPFAEVTYHYGRWYEDSNQGWVWVPDTKWAPAWVEWRRNKQYVGWRPLPPENAPRRAPRGPTTTVVTGTRSPVTVEEEWIFVPSNRIVDRVDTVMIQRQQVIEVYSQTQVIGRVQERGGIYVNISLQPADLQRDSNITIQSRNLPKAQAVPVPPQVQKISTETRANSAAPVTPSTPVPAATAPAPSAPGATAPAATAPGASAPVANAPGSTAPTGSAPAASSPGASTPAPSTAKSGQATTPGATPGAGNSSSTSTPSTAGGTSAPAASTDKPAGQGAAPAGVQKNSQPVAAPAPKPATGGQPATSAPTPNQSGTPSATPSGAEKLTSTPKSQTAPPATKSQNASEPARGEQKQDTKKPSDEKPPVKSDAGSPKAATPNEKGSRESDENKQAPKIERPAPKAVAPNGPTPTRAKEPTNDERTEPNKK